MRVFTLIIFFLISCKSTDRQNINYNSTADRVSEINSEDKIYKYQFDDSNCTTGSHEFDHKEDYCLALSSDILNDSCAEDLRNNQYQLDCSVANASSTTNMIE